MAVQLLTGAIELMAVSDGSQLEIRMGASGNRTQYYDDAGNHYPNYENNAEVNSRPKFWPVITDTTSNSVLSINSGSGTWKYNGATLVFDSNGVCTGTTSGASLAGMFVVDQYEVVSGVTVPRLTIVKNLGSSTNDDSDTIEFVGSVNLDGGNPFEVSVSSYINIARLAAGTTDAISIYAVNGQEFDYDNSTQDELQFQPYMIAGNVEKGNTVPSGYSLHVYGVGVYSSAGSTTALDTTYAGGTSNVTVTINADQVNDEGILVFELLKDGTKVSTAAIQLYDNGDPDNVTISATATKDGTTRPVAKDVKSGESVTLTVKVTDRNTGADKTSTYINRAWFVHKHNGDIVPKAQLSGLPTASSKSTTMTITYAEIRTHGGVFVACSVSKSGSTSELVNEIVGRRTDFTASYFE